MMKRLVTLAMVAMFATVAFAQSPTTKPAPAKSKAMAAVQGTWYFTHTDGQDVSGGPEIVVTITDDKYTQTVNGAIVERGSFKIDDAKKPMLLDINIIEGDEAGKTQLGVLELEGKTMRGKLNMPGSTERPTDLIPAEGFFAFTAVKR